MQKLWNVSHISNQEGQNSTSHISPKVKHKSVITKNIVSHIFMMSPSFYSYIYIPIKRQIRARYLFYSLFTVKIQKNRVKAITIHHTISIPIIRVHYTVTLSMITLKGWPNCKSFDPLSYMFPNIQHVILQGKAYAAYVVELLHNYLLKSNSREILFDHLSLAAYMLCFRSLATHFLKKVLAATIYYSNHIIQKLYFILVTIYDYYVIQ